jgi:hypothetical protein
MFIWKKVKISDDLFKKFEVDGINFIINTETFKIYHFETGCLMDIEITGSRWKTVMKKFIAMAEEQIGSKSFKLFNRRITQIKWYNDEKQIEED